MKSNTAELMLVNHSLEEGSFMIDKHQDSAEMRNKPLCHCQGTSMRDRWKVHRHTVLPDLPQNKKPNQFNVFYKTYKSAATVTRRPYMLCHKNFVMEFRFCFTRELQQIDCRQQSTSCKENLLLNPVRV